MKLPKIKKTVYDLTIADIAQMSGVTPAVVSTIINNRKTSVRFSQETRQKVLNIIDQIGYRPQTLGKSLVLKKSFLIGMAVGKIEHSFNPTLIHAVQEQFAQLDYGVLLTSVGFDLEHWEHSIRFLLARRIDGLIVTGLELPDSTNQMLDDLKIPRVFLAQKSKYKSKFCSSVYVDGAQNGNLACEHLVKSGHQNIGAVNCCRWVIEGIKKTLKANENFEEWYFPKGTAPTEIVNRWKNTLKKPTALLFNSDQDAIWTINAFISEDVKIPKNLSIIGIDGIEAGVHSTIPLTTVSQPKYVQGEKAVKVLFDMIENKGQSQEIMLAPQLVIRKSVRNLVDTDKSYLSG